MACIGEPSFRKGKIGFSPVPILQPVVLSQLNISFRYHSGICYRTLSIGFVFPSSCFCHTVIPNPDVLASNNTILSLSFELCAKHEPSVSICFMFPNSSSCSVPQLYVSFFFDSFWSRSVLSKNFGRKNAINCIAPRNDLDFLYSPVDSISKWILLFLRSVSFRFHQFRSSTILSIS